ncbi:MAG: 4'-phosphopantetheinyl transferase superfamily protein [Oscillospiraceae bacterium]|nr:4'-phosphopantetheinyl transferase superfamily protein [Oscillospiraceae bacterium]
MSFKFNKFNESDRIMVIFSTRRSDKSGSETVYDLLRAAFLLHYGAVFPEIKKTINGKPHFPNMADIHFSLSHAQTHVLCVIADKPVGCDIEVSNRVISQKALRYFCSDKERDMFDPLDLWLLKESYVKLLGGTFGSIRRLHFLRDGAQVIFPDPDVCSKLYSIDGCRAAVCGYDPLPEKIILV